MTRDWRSVHHLGSGVEQPFDCLIVQNRPSERRRAVHEDSGVTRGHLPLGAAFWGRQIVVGMLRNIYKMSNASGCHPFAKPRQKHHQKARLAKGALIFLELLNKIRLYRRFEFRFILPTSLQRKSMSSLLFATVISLSAIIHKGKGLERKSCWKCKIR